MSDRNPDNLHDALLPLFSLLDGDREKQQQDNADIRQQLAKTKKTVEEIADKMHIIISFCEKESQKDEKIKELKQRLEQEQSKHSKTRIQLDALNKQLETLEKAMEALKSSQEDLKNKNRDTEDKLRSDLSDSENERTKLECRNTDLTKQLEEKDRERADAIQKKEDELADAVEAADALKGDMGPLFQEYAELYRRFKASSYVNDTAMYRLYGDDYPQFFARCSNEALVTEFYKELNSIVAEKEQDYIQLADELLNFCVAACSQVNHAVYGRQEVQVGADFYANQHIAAKGSGKIIRNVFLHGLTKEGQTLPQWRSYVEKGEE